jgi:hypothetical protein
MVAKMIVFSSIDPIPRRYYFRREIGISSKILSTKDYS